MMRKILTISVFLLLVSVLFSGCVESSIIIDGTLTYRAYPPIDEVVPTCMVWVVQKNDSDVYYLTKNKTPLCSLEDYGYFTLNDTVRVEGIYHKLTKYDDITVKYDAIEIINITRINIEAFDIHEWGVFVKGYNCNETFLLSESPPIVYVRKPVIYFHSLINKTNILIEISSISNASVIPDARLGNNQIIWDVPVKDDIISLPNGTLYPYLFYEGKTNFSTNILLNITTFEEKVTFYVKNQENYAITNIYLIYGYPTGTPDYVYRGMTYVYIDKLEMDEEKSITMSIKENITYDTEELFVSLVEKGLTSEEALELINYWEEWWFYPSNLGTYTRMIYMIPQSVYDKILPLKVIPEPASINRIGLFVLTNIPVNTL